MSDFEAIPLPPAAPGEEIDLSLSLVAPTRLGRMRSTWKGRDPGGAFFEFPLWVEIVVAGSPDDDGAVFVSDLSYPPNTVLPANQPFLKQWKVKNTGTTTWGSSYSLAYFSDEKLGARIVSPYPKPRPGRKLLLASTFTSPAVPGSYAAPGACAITRVRNSVSLFLYC